MKIALLGYGKMGKTIESLAISRGHEIVLRKSTSNGFDGLELADVAIDFSIPSAAAVNITTALQAGIPVISGTTGWLEDLPIIEKTAEELGGAFIYGSNFSLGVNLFFELNRRLAMLMTGFPDYQISMREVHHTQKLDSPSGTAISLAKDIIGLSDYTSWALGDAAADEIPIDAQRIENVPGTHTVFYRSPVDTIEITHTAHSREGFALGAVVAAEWLVGKTGIFTMSDVLELNK